MNAFISQVRTFIADEDGVTAIEYALMASLIAMGIAFSVEAMATGISGLFDRIVLELA